jgi:DNA-binding transcriptional LysR family regulator
MDLPGSFPGPVDCRRPPWYGKNREIPDGAGGERMEFRELKYFLEVAKDRSFTRAANRLFLSQPALSRAIKRLEQELGVRLFESRGNGVELTDCGKALQQRAFPLINEIESLGDCLQDIRSLKAGAVSMGITPMIGTLFMAPIIIEFCNRWPGVELQLFENGSKIIRRQIALGELDLGVCLRMDGADDLSETVVFCDEMVAFIHQSNPLSELASLRFEQLAGERFNMYSPGAALSEQIVGRCVAAGFLPQINLKSSKAHFVMKMTGCGKGICLLPRPYAEQFILPELRMVPFEPRFDWVCCVATRKNGYRSYAARTLQAHVVQSFGQLSGAAAAAQEPT